MPGVEQSYALQAGREIRVIARPNKVDDARIEVLASDLAARIAAHHGIVTARELLDDGFSRRSINRLSERHALHRVHNGVYRVATSPDTFESRCAAACAADRQAVVTGEFPAGGQLVL